MPTNRSSRPAPGRDRRIRLRPARFRVRACARPRCATPTASGRIANIVRIHAALARSAAAVSASPWRKGSGSSSASICQLTGPPGQRVGLVVAGHQHGGVGRRAEVEGEVAVGVDVEVVVAHDRHDPVRPRPRRRFVVGGHREVHAVALVAADAIAALRVDRAHVVVGVGVVPAPAAVAAGTAS